MAVHVRYKSLYISVPSSVKQQRELTSSQKVRTLGCGVDKGHVVDLFKVHFWKAKFICCKARQLSLEATRSWIR